MVSPLPPASPPVSCLRTLTSARKRAGGEEGACPEPFLPGQPLQVKTLRGAGPSPPPEGRRDALGAPVALLTKLGLGAYFQTSPSARSEPLPLQADWPPALEMEVPTHGGGVGRARPLFGAGCSLNGGREGPGGGGSPQRRVSTLAGGLSRAPPLQRFALSFSGFRLEASTSPSPASP